MPRYQPLVRSFLLATLATLAGCNSLHTVPVEITSPKLRGAVHGGQQPVSGASIQLYAVGTSGDGSTSTPLLVHAVATDSSGGFNITADYTCPSPASLVYLVGTGGDPGTGKSNPSSALVAALGACGALSNATFISVNELTTVASLFPVSSFAASYSSIGSSTADAAFLAAAFSGVNTLVDTSSGTVPGPNVQDHLTVPTAELNTLADIIATCVNSNGGVSGDGSACGSLFQLAKLRAGSAPTNTADAVLAIAQSPTQNVAGLYSLAPATGPFQPTLTSPPTTWSDFLIPAVPQEPALLGEYLLTEATGNIAHDSSGHGNDASLNGTTWEGSYDLNFTSKGQYMQLPSALNAAQSWQFAVYWPPFGSAQLPLAPGYGAASDFGINPSLLCGNDTSHVCFISGGFGRASQFQAFNTDNTQSAVPLGPGWHIVSLLCGGTVNGTQTKAHILYDGQEVNSYLAQGSNTCPTATSGNYQIGGSSQYSDTWFIGKLAAAWAWDAPLTVAQASTAATTALAFIRSKGVVTQYATADNPTPLLLTGIDSRTAGYLLPNPSDAWPFAITLDKPLTRINLAASGATAYDTCIQFNLLFGEQLPQTSGPVVIALWGGVNDITFTGQTAAQIAASLQCMVQKAKAFGATTILATEISSNSPSGPTGDNGKNALNSLIRANAFAWGVDSIADLATQPILGADGASANSNCFVDTLHLSEACEPYVTSIMQNAINELIGSTQAAPHSTAAAAYQEVAGDRFLTLSGTQAQTVTLPSCIGYSLPRYITTASLSASIATANGEVLTGNGVIAPSSRAALTPVPGPLSAGGCTWSRTQ